MPYSLTMKAQSRPYIQSSVYFHFFCFILFICVLYNTICSTMGISNIPKWLGFQLGSLLDLLLREPICMYANMAISAVWITMSSQKLSRNFIRHGFQTFLCFENSTKQTTNDSAFRSCTCCKVYMLEISTFRVFSIFIYGRVSNLIIH